MIDMFVIKGTNNFICQSCGKELLPLNIGQYICKCGQRWKVDLSRGEPFALMELVRTGHSSQAGNPYYNSGWLVRAVQSIQDIGGEEKMNKPSIGKILWGSRGDNIIYQT